MIEFRSKLVDSENEWAKPDLIERTCNEWAAEGWEVFSVVVPQGSNYHRYRITAKRTPQTKANVQGRRFR